MKNVKTAAVFVLIVIVLALGWYILDLPPEDEVREIIVSFLLTYGPIVILIGAFLEGLLGVGFYFPGSMLIFISVAFSPNPVEALKATAIATLGLYLGYLFDYALGKYGWYKLLVRFGFSSFIESTKNKLETKKEKYIFLTFWGPGLAVMTSTAAGILQIPFWRFALVALLALILWNTFWGTLVFNLGEAALMMVGYKFILIGAVAWLALEVVKSVIDKRKHSTEQAKEL